MALFMKQFFKKEIVKEESLILRVLQFKLCSVLLAYLGQFKSKSPIQGHFWKLEIKGFHLAPRFMGFYSFLTKILAPKKREKNAMLFARPCKRVFFECSLSALIERKGLRFSALDKLVPD